MGIVGHNPTYVSLLTVAGWGFIWGAASPFASLWRVRRQSPGSFGYFTNPRFSNSLSMLASFSDLIFSFIKSLFACMKLAWWIRLPPPPQTKWQYNGVSHRYMFSCRPKRCWSQINEFLILSHNALSLAMKFVEHCGTNTELIGNIADRRNQLQAWDILLCSSLIFPM